MMMYSYSVVFALLASTVVSQDVESSPTRRYLRAFSRRVIGYDEENVVDELVPVAPPSYNGGGGSAKDEDDTAHGVWKAGWPGGGFIWPPQPFDGPPFVHLIGDGEENVEEEFVPVAPPLPNGGPRSSPL